ncbi:penicillin-binding protein [Sutcliffiella horikoshii]|uniref:transglycosylase domain-containing protein n=1 Tax=Sutcliffiella horikoshii TaxID=79883 RepID=UPI001CBDD888|nr:transglycosylase domain-containing protein [Sutcliffiella horikoshii]UAL46553.1 penicillin-binding protein [Sutcliffiella horikoshii]
MSNYDKFKEKSQTFFQFFINNKTKKGANITYLVVWNLILVFLVIGVIGVSFAGGAGAGYFAALVKEEPVRSYEDLRKNIYNYEESTEMYFANDVYLGKYRADLLREEVSLDNVSEHLINALVSTEDEYFYEHEGVVPKAIVRAVVQEVTNSANQTGGSTLTQQLIKNQILTNDVSFDRKAKEILLALRLENYFSKEEILEAYLNVSPFGRDSNGRNIAGAQTAAEGIFGVDISELSIPQAAFIAGLPQSPFAYTPFTRAAEVKTPEGLEPGLDRMRYVLHRMHEMGHIDDKQYEEALAYDITKDLAEPTSSAIEEYPYVAFEIEERAQEIIAEQLALNDGYEQEELDNNEELLREYLQLADTTLRQKGYVIKTTIDKEIYSKMRQITQEFPYFDRTLQYSYEEEIDPDTNELVKRNAEQVGALLMDNKTGAIISFVGGRDFTLKDLNFATNTWRHNGSTMKPLLGYAPAYEMGTLQPGSILADTPLTVNIPGQRPWSPNNWNNTFNGLQTVRESVALSHNLAAIRGYMEILPQRPMEYLYKQNFKKLTQGDAENISAVLGSPSVGVSVEENTAGYVTFANGGNYVEPYLIESIKTKDGEVIYEHKVEPKEIYSPQTAYLMIDTMRDTFRKGTAGPARDYLQFSSDWAGKTGTTQDTHDIWMMGSNPNITFGLWMGYDERVELRTLTDYRTPTKRSQLLWAQLLNGAYDINPELIGPSGQFQMPGGIVRRSYCKLSGLLPSALCQKAGLVGEDIFNAKYAPTKTDDSLTTGKYVRIGDVAYAPLSSTPSEFVKEGPMIKPDFLKKLQLDSLEELAKYMKDKSIFDGLTVLSDDPLPANGSAPKQVGGVNVSGSTLTWSSSSERDVIGYYVYYKANSSSSARKIASVQAGDSMSTKISQKSGFFYVTAVNASGKESSPSSSAKLGDPDKKEEPKPKPKPDPKPKPPSNGGGNGNGSGNDGGGNDDGDDDGDDNSTDPPPDDSGDDGED